MTMHCSGKTISDCALTTLFTGYNPFRFLLIPKTQHVSRRKEIQGRQGSYLRSRLVFDDIVVGDYKTGAIALHYH